MNARPADDKQKHAPRRILLTGFMCAGKTTVGRELARLLDCAFVDLDDLITDREGRTPQQLIDEDGEAHFRELETRALRDALENSEALIIATGGGAWTLERNRTLVVAHACFTVWLDAPFELCWQRIESETNGAQRRSRPLARDEGLARRLYDSRRASYRLADARIMVDDDRDVRELAGRIAEALEKDEKGIEGT